MTTETQTQAGWEAVAGIEQRSHQRIDRARPPQLVSLPIETQQRILNLIVAIGDARAGEDFTTWLDLLAEREAVFLCGYADHLELIEVEKCPVCGGWPLGQCHHTDRWPAFVARDGPGGMGGDPSGRNRALYDRLKTAGDAKRAELAATQAQRVTAMKAEVLAAMRVELEAGS